MLQEFHNKEWQMEVACICVHFHVRITFLTIAVWSCIVSTPSPTSCTTPTGLFHPFTQQHWQDTEKKLEFVDHLAVGDNLEEETARKMLLMLWTLAKESPVGTLRNKTLKAHLKIMEFYCTRVGKWEVRVIGHYWVHDGCYRLLHRIHNLILTCCVSI